MSLRKWQSECLSTLLKRYKEGKSHCLVTATPGAGKTYFAATLTKQLFDLSLIDFVICIAPSVDVAESFKVELSSLTSRRMDGRLGSHGESRTYHSLAHLDEEFWGLLEQNRVLIIFDEIHHCGGQEINSCNSWGLQILKYVKDKATYTLALSGTPWRSDRLPVTLNSYCNEVGMLSCDYTYSLSEAIEDGVCRIPQITVIDNSDLHYEAANGDYETYPCIHELLSSGVPFQQLLNNDQLITYILQCAVKKLCDLRHSNPIAAGLIVASNIEHANHIAGLLKHQFDQQVVVITSHDKNARKALQNFKQSAQSWVVSVGMISEGTNIPRLQVCCYLSRIKTELYFRQVLGRILRATPNSSKYAYLFMLAEPKLKEFAERTDEDIPQENILVNVPENISHPSHKSNQLGATENSLLEHQLPANNGILTIGEPEIEHSTLEHSGNAGTSPEQNHTESFSGTLKVYGTFLEQLIALEKVGGAYI